MFYGFINLFYLFMFLIVFSVFIVSVSAVIILPFENLIKKFYIIKAKNKLKKYKDLIIVAITGSYGKTSTKKFLYEVLKSKFDVCCSPNSYNTEMGITKTILNELKPYHKILILEFGADRKNDIKKLCKIAKPDISVVTAVGEQHLKTFKTVQNIINTKYQIVEGTKENGVFVTNIDNKICNDFFNKTKIKKFAVSRFNNDSFCYVVNYEENRQGLKVDVVINGESFLIDANILGEFNIDNLLIVISIAKLLGLNLQEIKNGIKQIKPVKHRLELKQLSNGAVLIDDSFNSNPVGANCAVKTIKKIADKTIVITCGMVELGKMQYKLNYEFGKSLGLVDIVLIVNDVNFLAIKEGASSVGNKQVIGFNSFNLAFDYAIKNSNENTAILIENDLTDSYIV